VFERLLPTDNIPRRCVVFELHTPHQFAIWRDATYAVLSACSGGIKEKRDGKPWLISSYPRYKSRFCRPYEGHKLELASHPSKYDNTRKPPLLYDAVIKPHSMSKYRVLNDGLWVSNPFSSDSETAFRYLRDLCAMEVTADGPYKTLQFSVSGTNHTSNQIIASQDACSTAITLHDYEAFGHLMSHYPCSLCPCSPCPCSPSPCSPSPCSPCLCSPCLCSLRLKPPSPSLHSLGPCFSHIFLTLVVSLVSPSLVRFM